MGKELASCRRLFGLFLLGLQWLRKMEEAPPLVRAVEQEREALQSVHGQLRRSHPSRISLMTKAVLPSETATAVEFPPMMMANAAELTCCCNPSTVGTVR